MDCSLDPVLNLKKNGLSFDLTLTTIQQLLSFYTIPIQAAAHIYLFGTILYYVKTIKLQS